MELRYSLPLHASLSQSNVSAAKPLDDDGDFDPPRLKSVKLDRVAYIGKISWPTVAEQ